MRAYGLDDDTIWLGDGCIVWGEWEEGTARIIWHMGSDLSSADNLCCYS